MWLRTQTVEPGGCGKDDGGKDDMGPTTKSLQQFGATSVEVSTIIIVVVVVVVVEKGDGIKM